MPTQKKIETVEEYTQKFKNAKSIFMADFGGINVAQANKLRRSFREANVEYKILKNTLAKRSFDDAGIEGVDQLLSGMTGFALSNDDPVTRDHSIASCAGTSGTTGVKPSTLGPRPSSACAGAIAARPVRSMHSCGQTSTHMPHAMHFS